VRVLSLSGATPFLVSFEALEPEDFDPQVIFQVFPGH
jgi:hypothetical protein